MYEVELTREESTNAKGRSKVCLLGKRLVFQTVLDIQRVGKHDYLPVRDALAVVEVAHHLHKV